MSADLPPEGELGPAMRALPNDRQRRFVRACDQPDNERGQPNYTRAAREAGYVGDNNTLGVTGWRLAHDERIQAAMLEEAQKKFSAALPLATAQVIQILTSSTKNGERMKAAAMIFNRAGMPERTEHFIRTERVLSPEEKISHVVDMAKALGLDPKTLLGNLGVGVPRLAQPTSSVLEIEAEFEEVEPLADWKAE